MKRRLKISSVPFCKEPNKPSEDLMKDMLEIHNMLSEGILFLDKSLRIIHFNQAVRQALPNSGHKLIGQSLFDIKEPYIPPEFLQACQRAIDLWEKESFVFQSTYLGIWIESTIYPTQKGLTVLFKDITKHIEATKTLKTSHEIYTMAFSASPIPLAIAKLADGLFLEVNTSFEKLTGFSREEVIGQTPDSLKMVLNGSKWSELLDIHSNNMSITNLEADYFTKQGERRTGLFSFQPIQLNDELCVIGAYNDITDLKRLQVEIARLDRLNLIGVMAAGLGHEIRNPLTTVRGFLQLLGGQKEFEPAKGRFELMISELDRSNAIITEFLSLAKSKTSILEETNLNDIMDHLYPLLLSDAMSRDQMIQLELDPVSNFKADEKEIRQLILNLVRNGLESMDSKGTITIKTFMENGRIVLAIRDQGCGIGSEILNKLGTPFFTTKDTGTGLGLAICYGIAQRHKAVIDVDSSPEGTVFYVKF